MPKHSFYDTVIVEVQPETGKKKKNNKKLTRATWLANGRFLLKPLKPRG